jgi:glycosyltransferase involved in cell wall biosynthesis
MKKDIAILLPYKEKFNIEQAGAASIWVKDYLALSKLSNRTIVYGNLDKKFKPLTSNFKNINLKNKIIRKNIAYTNGLYNEYLKYNFSIIEIHNRPASLLHLLKKKIRAKLIFVFHNNPKDMRGSTTVKERIHIAENTHQIYFVSKWVKDKFFEGLPYKHKNNCEILYPAIKPLTKFPKKEKLIIFCGKLNSSKGYDIFGNAVLRILDKFKDWNAISIGNEPREKYDFKHKNFKVLDWIQHKKILNFYSKASISVVPSRWLEPFGRTAMESAAYGCATITSKNGGLPETFNNDLFLERISSDEIYRLIYKLIKNSKLRKTIQQKNFLNVKHKIQNKVKQLDDLKNFLLHSNIYFNRGKKIKILHISQFDDRNDYRLFNISISNKITKGLIRNGHDVINFSYRNYINKNFITDKSETINQKVLDISNNYRPDLILLGHNNFLYRNNIEILKSKYNCKISLWYEDALGKKAEGPHWRENLSLIEKNHDLIDSYFTTTHPDEILSIINKNKLNFLPIPVDENIENLNLYENKISYKDLFFALSHGVNFGKLKKRKIDEREDFIKKLMIKFPQINYNILGIAKENPKWNYDYYNELSKCKIALNLSRGKPIKLTSSNRIASLVGNGIYTFIDSRTQYNKIFNEDEMGSYKSINELGSKIEHLLSNENKIKKYAKKGKEKYFKLFNSKIITSNIIKKTFNL